MYINSLKIQMVVSDYFLRKFRVFSSVELNSFKLGIQG